MAFRVERPLRLVAVPAELEAVAVGVVQVQRLVGAVVVDAAQRVLGADQPPERVSQCRPGWVANGDVVEPGRAGRGRRAALRLPGIETERVVIAAGGDEECILAQPGDDVEAEDIDVELPDPLDVSGLEVDVADVYAGVNGLRGGLTGNHRMPLLGCAHG